MSNVRQLKFGSDVAGTGGITELIIANGSPEQAALFMPMIAFLSKSCKNRWVTWITSSHISRDFRVLRCRHKFYSFHSLQ